MPRPPVARHVLRLLSVACLLAAAATVPVRAQSLVELFDAARAYDASFLASRAQLDAAQFRTAQAQALNSLSIGLEGSATHAESGTPLGGRALTNGNVAINSRTPVFNRANDATIAQADRTLAIAQADVEAAEQDLIVRVAQAYFDVLAAIDTLNTTRAAKTAIAEQLAAAKRNFEVGTATITDTREAQATFDLATAREIQAENELRTRRIALDQLVGRMGVEPRPLIAPVTLPSVLPSDPDVWVATGEDVHPQIRKARLALEFARLDIDKAKAGQLPTVDLVWGLTHAHNSGTAVTTRPGFTTSGTFGVQMSMPLWTGGSLENRVRETVALEEKARNDFEAARRGVALTTRQAFFNVQSGQAQVRALEAAEASSKLALEATQVGYRVGVRINVDVLNAQAQLFNTQRDLARARYDVLVAGLRLRQAAGQLSVGDLASVNQLVRP